MARPILDKAGAGLPIKEHKQSYLFVRNKMDNATITQCSKDIETHSNEILELINNKKPEDLSKLTLIERLIGLEDNSRYWSVYMVLEHIRIVNELVANILENLCNDKLPNDESTIEATKPAENIGKEIVEQFIESKENVIKLANSYTDLETEVTFSHPWYGSMNALDWYCMCALHIKLHKLQIEKILTTLSE